MACKCMNRSCASYKKYKSIRKNSFFNDFDCDLRFIFKEFIMYAAMMPIFSIKNYLRRGRRIIERIIKCLVNFILEPDYSDNKLGGVGRFVQIDETMLSYKCKSHRGRSSTNRTDTLCIVEVINGISMVFGKLIPDKT
ncbi:hypothetical protein DMUE_4215 [Dictyocoela muelleri]|nr:hypothetical protein DMUE_4215 [Dictyocoela muelleri]